MSNDFFPVMGPVYTGRTPVSIPNMEHPIMIISGHIPNTRSLIDHLGEHDMGGSYGHYDHGLVERDEKLAKLYSRLSLAERSRNKTEVTRLTREIKILGQGW
jgi:hypothetical protein